MTPQEIFDRAVERLRDGTGPAQSRNGACMYLTSDGRKCVVGIFIPDGHPGQKAIWGVTRLLENHEDLRLMLGHASPMLLRLQRIHDDGFSYDHDALDPVYIKCWRKPHLPEAPWRLTDDAEAALSHVAEKFGVTYTPPIN